MTNLSDMIKIGLNDVNFEYVRSSGPGGQNVNKVSTAVQLRFPVNTGSLPPDVRERLVRKYSNRINQAGELVIHAQRFRTQSANRKDAFHRLMEMIRDAALPPKTRKKTKIPKSANEARIKARKYRSEIKRLRKKIVFIPDA